MATVQPVIETPPGGKRHASTTRPQFREHQQKETLVSTFESLQVVSPQQSPTATARLSSLYRRIRCDQLKEAQPTMAEALLGLTPSYNTDPSSNKFTCASVDSLQTQLRGIITSKVSATRAEHVSVTFQIRATVEFTLNLTEGENEALENLANVDPALAGTLSMGRPQSVNGQTVRIVRANDSLMSQPQDDPVLQRSVARHIISIINSVDGSTWVVREMSRGSQGWTFAYACKDSLQAWVRQNAKNKSMPVVGDFSLREPDPVVSSRPAFDCRGSVSIAFSKNSRSINVKYDHTPLHKTVAQMIDHFKPPPAVPVPPPAEVGELRKTPRKRELKAQEEGSASRPKKRKKKNADELGVPVAPMNPSHDQVAAQPESGEAFGLVGEGGNGSTSQSAETQATVQSGVHSHSIMNVPPAEAARRRETAIKMLSESGVPPETLTAEQFNIFANQSPELQKDSLLMLVKYGAERLRVVHPNPSKDTTASASSSATASAQQTPEQATSAAASNTVALQTPTASGKTNGRRKENPDAASGAADDSAVADGEPTATTRTVRLRKSRGACTMCRERKVKCGHEKPSCLACQSGGYVCEYPLVQPRGKKGEKSAARLAEEDLEQEEQGEPEPDDIQTIDYTSNMPVASMLTPAADTSNHDYFQTGSSSLSFENSINNGLGNIQGMSSSTSLAYSEPPDSDMSFSEQRASEMSSNQTALALTSPKGGHHKRKSSKSTMRRSVLSGQAVQPSPASEPHVPLSSYAMGTGQDTGMVNVAANPPSPTTARQQRARKAAPKINQHVDLSNSYDGIQHAASLSQAALHPSQPSPVQSAAQSGTPAHQSPFQAPAQTSRAKSRTGHKAQTRAPLADQRAQQHTPSQQISQPPTQQSSDASTYNRTSDMSGIPTYNSYNTHNPRYSDVNNDQTTSKVPYEPYSAQASSAASTTTSYPSYGNYNNNRDTSTSLSNPPTQAVSTSYPSTAAPSAQWSNNQTPNNQTYSTSSSASATTSYNQPSSTTLQQGSSLQSFGMRAPAAGTQARSSSKAYTKQPQQPYGSYSSRAQQQPESTQHQQQQPSWFGFGSNTTSFTPANATPGFHNRNSAAANYGTGSSNTDSYQQHQGALNMPTQSFGSGGDDNIFDLLKNSLSHNSRA